MARSSRHRGWRWDQANSRLNVVIDGTVVAYFNDATADLTLANSNGISGISSSDVGFTDNALLQMGTGADTVLLNRSTILSANATLAGVTVGTPETAAVPANSLMISNITADGDIVLITRNAAAAHSIEMLRMDASAGEVVVNDGSADVNFRVESDGNTNAIFVEGSSANVGINNGSPGVALDVTGAITSSGIISADEFQMTGGGTGSQSSAKTDTVVINTSTGVITGDNASLAAATEVVFILTNSTINATSVVILSHADGSGGDPESYLFGVGNVKSGSCEIHITNLTGGALTDAIVLNFVVIGGASS